MAARAEIMHASCRSGYWERLMRYPTLVMVLCVAMSANVSADDPPTGKAVEGAYKLSKGPYAAATAELILRDDQRKVDIPIHVRYPRDAVKPVPLVVFSHGMGGSFDAFESLTKHWASHGYVVILPTHADSVRRQQRGDGAEILRDPKGYRRRVDPLGRVADVRRILDSLDEIESRVTGLKLAGGHGLIDREHMVIAGHSAGAMTTQLAVGVKARFGLSRELRDCGDPRFDAAIVISGQGTTSHLFTRDSWAEVKKPMLVITGSKDTSPASDETPESRRHPYGYAPPGEKYLLYIEGATHSSYQGNDRQAQIAQRLRYESGTADLQLVGDAVAAQTLAFLDAYLRDDTAALTYLKEDMVTKLGDAITAQHK